MNNKLKMLSWHNKIKRHSDERRVDEVLRKPRNTSEASPEGSELNANYRLLKWDKSDPSHRLMLYLLFVRHFISPSASELIDFPSSAAKLLIMNLREN